MHLSGTKIRENTFSVERKRLGKQGWALCLVGLILFVVPQFDTYINAGKSLNTLRFQGKKVTSGFKSAKVIPSLFGKPVAVISTTTVLPNLTLSTKPFTLKKGSPGR